MEVNEQDLIAYIVGRFSKDYHREIAPNAVELILNMEMDYYDQIGLTQDAAEVEKQMEEHKQVWNIIYDLLEEVTSALEDNGLRMSTDRALEIRSLLQKVDGGIFNE